MSETSDSDDTEEPLMHVPNGVPRKKVKSPSSSSSSSTTLSVLDSITDALAIECLSYMNCKEWGALQLISRRYHRLMIITPRHLTLVPSLSFFNIRLLAMSH